MQLDCAPEARGRQIGTRIFRRPESVRRDGFVGTDAKAYLNVAPRSLRGTSCRASLPTAGAAALTQQIVSRAIKTLNFCRHRRRWRSPSGSIPAKSHRSYRIRLIASQTVIPENASAFIRDLNKRWPEFAKIPDNAFGVSGMTAANYSSESGITEAEFRSIWRRT